MNNNDHDDLILPQQSSNVFARLLPPLILIAAIGGFVSLAIYAYKAGSNNVVQEGDLMVVEADKTPMKEKPEDPGGMQFPNQDKTIFETIEGNKSEPQAKVERVLPSPEEPMAKQEDSAETQTWINDKIATKPEQPAAGAAPVQPVTAEQVFGDDNTKPAADDVKPVQPKVVDVRGELGKQAVAEPVPVTKPVDLQPKPEPFTPEKAKAETPKPAPKAEKKPLAQPGAHAKGLVQLGAYKSEEEARADFAKLAKKASALKGLSPVINRADLGEKGVFYRLRVAADDAKALCASVTAAGLACMAVK